MGRINVQKQIRSNDHQSKSANVGNVNTNVMAKGIVKQQPNQLAQLKANSNNVKQPQQNKTSKAKYIPPHKRPDGPKTPTPPLGGKRKHSPKLPSTTNALTRPPSPKEIVVHSTPSWRDGSNALGQRYRPQPIQMHSDTPFYSGAWLFDLGQAPTWLRIQLTSRLVLPTRTPTSNTQLVGRIRLIGSKLDKAKNGVYQLPPIQLIFYKQPSPLPSFHYARYSQHMSESDISDNDFVTGAWLFDASRVPLWMQLEMPQLATALVLRCRNRCSPMTKSVLISRNDHLNARKGNANTSRMGQVIKCGSVKAEYAHSDDAFYSGAWMFDESVVPQWLAAQLPAKKRQVKQTRQKQPRQPSPTRSNGQSKRPRSARH